MNKKMLIDASYKEETRVVILDGNCIESYDIENSAKKQLKGNIYLAKIIRIEPSLQAAFVDYGGNRHGFLAFNEIHPDYYQIPIADRNKLLEIQELNRNNYENSSNETNPDIERGSTNEESKNRNYQFLKHYKIQEVIHKRQIILVQVVKEERGNKGAALTTYLSLAGRYCVLMPNSLRNGGISRKITSPAERKRLKDIVEELNIPAHMGMIIRTAGAQCSKADALKDGEYLLHLWDEIRNLTMKSIAPTLIYEDSNLLKLALRDIYTSDINEILIDGEEAWSQARDYMRALMPQNVHKLHLWRDQKQSLFTHYKIENLIDQMLSPIVQLKSGGYLVINQTEALVAIDVNSGRSIKERDLEETALRTNQEAAQEIARQLRLRDLAGLIVIDFIDMENKKHNYLIERRLKSFLHKDRARIQISSISSFGLLEMTRQRLRPSIAEFAFTPCAACNGTGIIRSDSNISLQILRQIDEEARKIKPGFLTVSIASSDIALHILNQKRNWLTDIEKKYKIKIDFAIDVNLSPQQVRFVNKTDPSIENEAENDPVTSSSVLLQDNIFIREIPIQASLNYPRDLDELEASSEKDEKLIEMEIKPQDIIQTLDLSQEEQPAIPFYPTPETQEENATSQENKKDKKNSRYTRRNRYKKTHNKNHEDASQSETDTMSALPLSDLQQDSSQDSAFVPLNMDQDRTTLSEDMIRNIPISNELNEVLMPKNDMNEDVVESSEDQATKTVQDKKSNRRSVKSKNTSKTTRKKAPTKKAASEVKEEKPEEKETNEVEKKPKTTKKTSTRARKTSTTKKTTDKKTQKTESTKKKSSELPLIQPIVIDDSPVKTPRAGWWKR